ncbi:hypothetical protein PNEG_03535 [Pneumocystis murina B123]|uniref:Ubiquitin carboxyl-terminal hydrolase n=1 Tax=Pneumocystis murina (strain B123) TaxID=1069680 RepID=M7P2I6_PNEMU|nr:hypothetical protein PNEG_03535 [Pneumocystis murina B123]EMR08095.1 hypothetical protein PNEG_03535 [Pneumocystis murina B123]
MVEQDLDKSGDNHRPPNGYIQRHFPMLPWYSAPDKPFPRRKYKCLKCLEMMKRSSNAQVETALSEKKSQVECLVMSREKISLNEVSEDKEVNKDDMSVQDNCITSKSWSDLLKGPESSYSNGSSKLVITREMPSNNLKEVFDYVKLKSGRNHNVLIQPRGLINIGNVCFMNVILQVLVFCPPFYNLLDEIGKKMTHSLVNNTSLISALISFIREFPIIDKPVLNGGTTVKKDDFEEFGEPFIPEYVYMAMRGNKLFDSMRRGHQEDAEEFLGLLLDALHEEFVQEMKPNADVFPNNTIRYINCVDFVSTNSFDYSQDKNENEWVEVGPKQKTSIMRSATVSESPLTPIFTGNFRSILRVSGMKPSITLEPYRSLQLDIEPLHIGSIEEALQNITQPEVLNGDWHSSLGEKLKATKQVFIETFPQVLILHLKRFIYDNVGGAQKSYKNVHYPLQFEIPPTVMSPHRRIEKNIKFILFAVVYHHGMSASGGHYTVDLLRQDLHSWIRIDDTHISHILPEHVIPSSDSPNRFAYLLFYLRL